MATSEDEEFEFRRRAEADAVAAAPAPAPVVSHPLQDAAAGFAVPFQALGHDVMENYRQHATATLPSNVGDALSRAAQGPRDTGKMLADVLGLGSAPVQAVTHPLARAMAQYGPTPSKATPQGPVALQGEDASNAIESSLNTALAGARPKGSVLADALATNAPARTVPPPSISDLRAKSGALYETAKQQGVVVKPGTFRTFADDLNAKLAAEGLDHDLQPKAQAVINRISGVGNEPIDLTTLDNLRKLSTNATEAAAGNPSDRRLTRLITDKIDDFVGGLKPADTLAGNPEAAGKMLGDARKLWSQQAKAQTIEDLIDKAKLSSSGTFNQDQALRTQFQKLARNQRGMSRFTPDEQAAILKVAGGSPLDQTLFGLGRLAPTNLHAMGADALMGAAGVQSGHPMLGAAPTLIGIPARALSIANTSRNAKLASALMRRP